MKLLKTETTKPEVLILVPQECSATSVVLYPENVLVVLGPSDIVLTLALEPITQRRRGFNSLTPCCPPVPVDLSETAITVFSVLGLFSSQATASLCIFFTAEIMPTVIR